MPTNSKNIPTEQICNVVARIPEGCVTSYGWVAATIGRNPKTYARNIGTAMDEARKKEMDVMRAKTKGGMDKGMINALIKAAASGKVTPWWRVINTQGRISLPRDERMREQKRLLKEEKWSLTSPKLPARKNRK